MVTIPLLTRRQLLGTVAAGTFATMAKPISATLSNKTFALRYVLASPMYGMERLEVILPQVHRTGAEHIDIWPRPHGNQREQIDTMGVEAFAELLVEHKVKLGVLTRYDLFPFDLREEMTVCSQLGGFVMVGHGRGSNNLTGQDLRQSVKELAIAMKPLGEEAVERGITLAIENHSNTRLYCADAIRWFVEMAPAGVGLAYAPHHLPQDETMQAKLIEACGDKLAFFYAQQHGVGSTKKQPRDQELLQMPGRGPLDFLPLIRALKRINYDGFTEIFMHPFPRGIAIHDTHEQVTAEINRARAYLDKCVSEA